MYSLSFLLLVSGLLNFVSSSKFKNKSFKQSDILFPWFTKKEKIPLSGYRVTHKESQTYGMYTVCFLSSLFLATVNLLLSLSSPNSAIDGNVEFVHTQYSCILTSQVSTKFDVSEKNINNSDHFRIKCLSDSKISAYICHLYFCF